MSNRPKVTGRHKKLKTSIQTTMGNFLSSETGYKSKKSKKMFSDFWTRGSKKDTEEYRNNYPGKRDDISLEDNLLFYKNELPSKPDGDKIDHIHTNWWGNFTQLERHHGYIQWLFPIRESGMNWHAQELQLHEAVGIQKDKDAHKRVLKSYKMMLDFFGMELKDETTGEVQRSQEWRSRFRHLNRSYHNYLRITRILKSLGELGYERMKMPFIKFVLYEAVIEETLDNLLESCVKFWIEVLRDDKERKDTREYYKKLLKEYDEREKQKQPERKNKGGQSHASAHTMSDSEEDIEKTLDYTNNINPNMADVGYAFSGDEEEMMKASDTVEESQEAQHWKKEAAGKRENEPDSPGGDDVHVSPLHEDANLDSEDTTTIKDQTNNSTYEEKRGLTDADLSKNSGSSEQNSHVNNGNSGESGVAKPDNVVDGGREEEPMNVDEVNGDKGSKPLEMV